jgi:hypothetical protein
VDDLIPILTQAGPIGVSIALLALWLRRTIRDGSIIVEIEPTRALRLRAEQAERRSTELAAVVAEYRRTHHDDT